MRVALAFPGCHRRGGVERVMLDAPIIWHLVAYELTSTHRMG
jgi:hypothetical protein